MAPSLRYDAPTHRSDLDNAQILWDYHCVSSAVPSCVDLLLVAGCHDIRVAEYAAHLLETVEAETIVTSGGFGKLTCHRFAEPEGKIFKRVMVMGGVQDVNFLVEDKASNTGENISYTRRLLSKHGLAVGTGTVVTKPYLKRRALATAEKQWPGVNWTVASPPGDLSAYAPDKRSLVETIQLMVGDTQRLELYEIAGFQTPQQIPSEVRTAYEELVDAGFVEFLLAAPVCAAGTGEFLSGALMEGNRHDDY